MTESKKLYSFDDFPEHKLRLPEFAEFWTKNALRTDPMSDYDRVASKQATLDMYALAKCAAPKVLFCDGPVSGAFAAAFLFGFIETETRPTKLTLTGHKSRDAVVKVLGQFFDMEPVQISAPAYVRDMKKWNTQDGSFKSLALEFGPAGAHALSIASEMRSDLFQSGQQSSDYCSFYSFFQEVAKLPIDWNPFDIYKSLALHSGERYVADEFCILCDRPTVLTKDDEHRPHAENGPFCEWADGFKLYAWHGVNIPAEFVENKSQITGAMALAIQNAEVRRAVCELIGWARVLESLKAKQIDSDADPEIGTLLEATIGSEGAKRFLRVKCGTGRIFAVPVPNTINTAISAQSWIYKIPEELMLQKEFRT